MIFLSNSFSAQMLVLHKGRVSVSFEEVSKGVFRKGLSRGFTSVIGHKVTAHFLELELGIRIPYQRYTLKLDLCDTLYIAQYSGGRLQENMVVRPENSQFKYIIAKIR